VELTSFLTIGLAQGKRFELFGQAIDVHSVVPWLISMVLLVGGGVWLARAAIGFKRVWDALMETVAAQGEAR
jgi:branched-chain amino acid transport system permease protein